MYIEPLNRFMAFLTVAGDEASELRFGLFNTETSEECLGSDNTVVYETNAVVGSFAEPYVIRFRSTTGTAEWTNSLQVYPNPVEHGQTFSLGFDDTEKGEVKVDHRPRNSWRLHAARDHRRQGCKLSEDSG